jgi:hypothetical protein
MVITQILAVVAAEARSMSQEHCDIILSQRMFSSIFILTLDYDETAILSYFPINEIYQYILSMRVARCQCVKVQRC